jgi:chemotaxis protein CheC
MLSAVLSRLLEFFLLSLPAFVPAIRINQSLTLRVPESPKSSSSIEYSPSIFSGGCPSEIVELTLCKDHLSFSTGVILGICGEMSQNIESNFSSLQLSAVKEVANIGLGHAATSLSDMTGKSFHITVPKIESVPVAELAYLLGGPEEVVVSVYMPFEGDIHGHIAFLFPWTGAQNLWQMLLGSHPDGLDTVGEMEASALLEVGNIINSSFLNAISDMTDLKMHATPPLMTAEMSASVIATIVAEAEMTDSVALAVETNLYEADSRTSGYFLCIPSESGLQTIFERLGISEAA